MTIRNPSILAAVEAALSTTDWRFPREVRTVMGENCTLAPTTVRHALAALAADGRATFEGGNGHRRYRQRDPERLAETRRVHAVAMAQEAE